MSTESSPKVDIQLDPKLSEPLATENMESTPKKNSPVANGVVTPTDKTPVTPGVQDTVINVDKSSVNASPKQQRRSRSKSLPRGKYTLVGIDIDTTGRRLIDEIVQLSAYTPTSEFSQYIMPYMNLNPAARQRHQLRVITVGFFRMLKSMETHKPIKTKSEIAALLEFLDWLEKLRKSDSDSQGIILIHHEKRKFLPYMLLEAFKKYGLLSRFLSSVRSFANGYDFASAKCANTVKFLNLRQLSKVLLNNEESSEGTNFSEGNASFRARMAYEITQHLAKGEQTDLSPEKEIMNMTNVIYEYSHPVSHEIAELRNQMRVLEMQNSLRPIFIQYFKATLFHRVKAVTYRRILSESGYELEKLEKLWEEKKRAGIEEIIEKVEELNVDEKKELIDLLDCHLDPQKSPMKPPSRPRRKSRSRRSSRRSRNNSHSGKSSDEKTDSTLSPDSTTKTSTEKTEKVITIETNNNTILSAPNVEVPTAN